MQLHFVALLKLILPVSLVVLAYWSREHLGELSEDIRIVVIYMPYLACIAVIFTAHQFNRCRLFLAALGVAALYWLLRTRLQVSLSDADAARAYMGASICLPVLSVYLLLIPERGIWNIHGLVASLGFSFLVLACLYAPDWLPGLNSAIAEKLVARPVEGYVLSYGVTAMVAVVFLLGLFLLCLRNNETEAAILACLLALYLALALLHLQFISVAMCAAAGLCLVYGLLRNSHAMAYRDDLTGLLGRRALNERLSNLGRRYSIAMLDVDHFKKFNDNHGHDVGDQVLRLVASRIKQNGGGKAYRYGGEEFCIVFPRIAAQECVEQLDYLRKSIAGYQLSLRDRKLRPNKTKQGSQKRGASRISSEHVSVTISIGVAERSEGSPDAESVIKAADENLYRAKRAGRNRVVS